MRDRVRYENEVMEVLGERGYQCLRSAGSRGAVDVFAFNASHTRLTQVKSTVDLRRHGNTNVFKTAIKDLLPLPTPPFCTKELWVRVLRKGWYYLTLDDVPSSEEELTAFVRNAEWIMPA